MIRKESLTKEDIQKFLKSYITTQTFGLRTGLFIFSLCCLFMTVMFSSGTAILFDKNVSAFGFMAIMLLGGLATFVIPIWLALKSKKFSKAFQIGAIPLSFIISIFSHDQYMLIINAVLLSVLIIIFIYKYANYLDYKNTLTTNNEKTIFEGTLTMCYKKNISITARYSNIHTIFTIQDESNTISFSLSNLKIMQLYTSGNSLPTEKTVGKEVIVSFLSTDVNTIMSFKYVE